MSDPPPLEERAKAVEQALDSTLAAIRSKAKEYQQLGESQRRRFNWARGATVVLGVLTPTFVTFQTQHTASPQLAFWLGLLAILITASTGIVTGLQATFRWGEGFGRASTTSLELDELASAIDLDTLLIRTSPDYTLKHTELTKHRDRALRQMQSIIRKYIEGELTVVTEGEQPQQNRKAEISAKTLGGP